MKPNGKCIARKCEECRFYENWDITKRDGIRTVEKKCSFEVLFKTIPGLIGSIDGVQRAANETRNRVQCLGDAMVCSKLIDMGENKLLENK